MKKNFGISLIMAMTVCGAHANPRTQISDVVRMMEHNPEYIDAAADAIVTARATKLIKNPGKITLKQPDTNINLKIGGLADEENSKKQMGHFDKGGTWLPDNLADVAFMARNAQTSLCNRAAYNEALKIVQDYETDPSGHYQTSVQKIYNSDFCKEWRQNNT